LAHLRHAQEVSEAPVIYRFQRREAGVRGKLGDVAGLTELLGRVRGSRSTLAEIYYVRAGLQAARGDPEQALADYSLAGILRPDWAAPRLAEAVMYLAGGRFGAAARTYRSILAKHPDQTEATEGLLVAQDKARRSRLASPAPRRSRR
jgi:Flp pilus assembly protein TadD